MRSTEIHATLTRFMVITAIGAWIFFHTVIVRRGGLRQISPSCRNCCG
jgi:hypothetical protein